MIPSGNINNLPLKSNLFGKLLQCTPQKINKCDTGSYQCMQLRLQLWIFRATNIQSCEIFPLMLCPVIWLSCDLLHCTEWPLMIFTTGMVIYIILGPRQGLGFFYNRKPIYYLSNGTWRFFSGFEEMANAMCSRVRKSEFRMRAPIKYHSITAW